MLSQPFFGADSLLTTLPRSATCLASRLSRLQRAEEGSWYAQVQDLCAERYTPYAALMRSEGGTASCLHNNDGLNTAGAGFLQPEGAALKCVMRHFDNLDEGENHGASARLSIIHKLRD